MEPTDGSFAGSFYREFYEEAEILKDGAEVDLMTKDGKLDIRKMKKFLKIFPVGLIKDDRDDVGKVHLGVACRILLGEGVDIRIRTKEGESANCRYITPETYRSHLEDGSIDPEGWTQIIFDEVLSPNRKS